MSCASPAVSTSTAVTSTGTSRPRWCSPPFSIFATVRHGSPRPWTSTWPRCTACFQNQPGRTYPLCYGKAALTIALPMMFGTRTIPTVPIDLVTSRAVLEHIPRAELQRVIKEMRRILRPTGVMVHTIDNSDHWQRSTRDQSDQLPEVFPGFVARAEQCDRLSEPPPVL